MGDLFEVPVRSIRLCLLLLTVLGATVARAETWAPLAKDGQQFTLTAPATIRYGVDGKWTVVQRGIGSFWCSYNEIADPALGDFSKRCEILVPDTATTPTAFQACYPAFTLNWPSLEVTGLSYVDVPVSVGSVADRFYKFRDACTNLITGQFSTPEERSSLRQALAAGLLDTSAALNAWTKTQPTRFLTAKEVAWRDAELAASNPAVPVATWKVQPIAAGTRPYGTANTAGTGITKKGDVAVGTACDGTKRIGQTNYYAVPSKGVGMYALCAVQ